jgi:hypothetical protein
VSFCTSMMVFSWSRQFLPSRHPPLQRPRVRPRLPCLMRLLPLRCLQPPQPRHQQTHVGGRRRCCRCCACSSERRQRRDKDDKSREHTPCGAAPTRQRPPRRIPAPARCAASCCPERRSGGGGSAICSARRQAPGRTQQADFTIRPPPARNPSAAVPMSESMSGVGRSGAKPR